MRRRSIKKILSFLFCAATLGGVCSQAEELLPARSDLPSDARGKDQKDKARASEEEGEAADRRNCPRESEKSGLESRAVLFEGGRMVLEGPLSFENAWGSIRADRAFLPKRTEKKFCFSKVDLEGDVVLDFKSEGELRCSQATFDKESGTAVFTVPQGADSWVVYKREAKARDGKLGEVLEVKAKRVEALLQEGTGVSGKELTAANLRIEAEGEVAIKMGDHLLANCGKALLAGDELTLLGCVEVDLGKMGYLKTDQFLKLERDGEGRVSRLECVGNCEFLSDQEDHDLGWSLFCPGIAVYDQKAHRVHLNKGGFGKENAVLQKPLSFCDGEERVDCNAAEIYLDPESSTIAIKKIDLEGDVRLVRGQGALEQYVLANRLVYDLESNQVHFMSKKPGRVLLYDKINNLQVSAPEIKLDRDKKTKKEAFQGVGDVRFHFAEKEFEQIRKHFQLEKSRL